MHLIVKKTQTKSDIFFKERFKLHLYSNMDCYWVLDAGADDLRILMFVTYDTSCPNDVFYIHDGKCYNA